MIFVLIKLFSAFLRVLPRGVAVGPQRPLNLPWTKKAPLDLFNAQRGAVPTPLGTTGLDGETIGIHCLWNADVS
jgi:hypothetical protein